LPEFIYYICNLYHCDLKRCWGSGRMIVPLWTKSYAVTVSQTHDGCGN